jgi:hypothetical protein
VEKVLNIVYVNDPYVAELWNPEVDVIVTPPKQPAQNYYFFDSPLEEDTYDSNPPTDVTKIVRKRLQDFENQEVADSWAFNNHRVIERLHTARCFAWRIKEGN